MAAEPASNPGITTVALLMSATVSGAVTGFLVLTASSGGFGLQDLPGTLVMAAFLLPVGMIFGLIFVLPVLVLVLLPLHALLRRFDLRALPAYAALLAIVGVPICLAIFRFELFPLGDGRYFAISSVRQILIGGVGGAVAGSVFWWFRRPDRDPPPTQSTSPS